MSHCIKNLDVFGIPVSLTFKKDPCIKSIFGGIITMIVRLGILAYLLYQCSLVLQKKNTIQYSIQQRDLRTDETEYILNEENFDMAVNMEYVGLSSETTDFQSNFNLFQYIYIKLNQNHATYTTDSKGTITTNKTKTEIELERCTEGRLGMEKDASDYLGIKSGYLCPKDFGFKLKGNQASENYEYIQFQLILCNQTFLNSMFPGQKCANKSDQMRIAGQMKVFIVLENSYFDDKDFSDEPIKNIIRPYFLYTSQNTTQHVYLQVGEHEVEMHDNIFHGDPKTEKFVETRLNYVSTQSTDANFTNGVLIVDIQIDDTVKKITRQVQTFLMAFSASGGFFTAIFVVAKLFVSHFQKNIYFTQLINSLFQHQTKENHHSSAQQKKKKGKRETKQPDVSPIDDEDPSNTFYETLLQQLKNRKSLVYTMKDQMKLKMKKFFCRQIGITDYTKEKLFKRGMQKVERELDIRYIVRELNTLRFIASVMLTKHQRFMIPYFNKHLLDNEVKEKKNKQEQIIQLGESLKILIQSADYSKLDKRILKNIDYDEEINGILRQQMNKVQNTDTTKNKGGKSRSQERKTQDNFIHEKILDDGENHHNHIQLGNQNKQLRHKKQVNGLNTVKVIV